MLQHLASLTALSKSVCDCVRELRASGASREETYTAMRELVAEHRVTGTDPEDDDPTLDAMVVSCLDDSSRIRERIGRAP